VCPSCTRVNGPPLLPYLWTSRRVLMLCYSTSLVRVSCLLDCFPYYLSETASCVKSCLLFFNTIYVRCMLRGIFIDSVLFLGVNISSTCIYLRHLSSLCVGQFSAINHICGVTLTAHISLTARLFCQKRHLLPETPSHTKQVHLFRGSYISTCSTQCILMVSTNCFFSFLHRVASGCLSSVHFCHV
jgi:hypothetical protein